MKIVQKFVQDDPAALDLFYKLDDTISKKWYRKMQQTDVKYPIFPSLLEAQVLLIDQCFYFHHSLNLFAGFCCNYE